MFERLIDNRATLHVLKNEALVPNIWANGKARNIRCVSTEQICDILYVGVGYFKKNAVANILT